MCLSELESRSAATVLEDLASTVRPDDARQLVREVGRRIGLEFRTGRFLSLQRGAEAAQLLELVQDPVVRVSFRSTYATALALAARYSESQDVARALLTDAEDFRLDFARPYGLATLAIAQAGSRDFTNAVHSISEARAFAQSIGNTHAEFNAYAIAVRILVQQGRHEEALRLKQPIGPPPGKGITGEVAATSALVKACLGRTAEAQSLLSAIRGLTQSVEATVLTPCVAAIIALINRESDAASRSEEAFCAACESGAIDLLISSYRSSSVFFATLLGNDTISDQFASVLSLASDESLAQALSPRPMHENEYRTDRLSRRERQVYDLVCQGLTNRQIAGVLFISEQTVKLHVHHIFDKLGTRSRTALVLAAARSQAAPRTDVSDLPSEPG
jgi:DNA-binding NarL/FixJ family response regulator